MSWLFGRGTLKAHWVVEGKSVCGSGKQFESRATSVSIERYKCKKCLKIQSMGSVKQ
jgi:hypothetical protein